MGRENSGTKQKGSCVSLHINVDSVLEWYSVQILGCIWDLVLRDL